MKPEASTVLERAGIGYFTIGSILKEGEDSFHSALHLAGNANKYLGEIREHGPRKRGLLGNLKMALSLNALKEKLEKTGEAANTSRMRLSLSADYLADQLLELGALVEASGQALNSDMGIYITNLEILGNSNQAQMDLLQHGFKFGINYLNQMALCMDNLTQDCRTALRVQKRVSETYVSTPKVLEELCQLHLAVVSNATQGYIPKGI